MKGQYVSNFTANQTKQIQLLSIVATSKFFCLKREKYKGSKCLNNASLNNKANWFFLPEADFFSLRITCAINSDDGI